MPLVGSQYPVSLFLRPARCWHLLARLVEELQCRIVHALAQFDRNVVSSDQAQS